MAEKILYCIGVGGIMRFSRIQFFWHKFQKKTYQQPRAVIRKFLIWNKFNRILNFFHIDECIFCTLTRTKVYAQILYLRTRSKKIVLLFDNATGHKIETKAKLTNLHIHFRRTGKLGSRLINTHLASIFYYESFLGLLVK